MSSNTDGSFFDFLNLGGLIKWVPPRMVRTRSLGRRIPRFLTEVEVKKLIGAAKTLHKRAALEVLYGTGCRVGELVSMKVKDIDFGARRIRVAGKAGTRLLMFTPRVGRILRAYVGKRQSGHVLVDGRRLQRIRPYREPSGGWRFYYRHYDGPGTSWKWGYRYIPKGLSRTFRQAQAEMKRRMDGDRYERARRLAPVSISAVERLVDRVGLRAGIESSPRMLRHSIATHLMDNDADLRVVQVMLGHTSIRTTEVYTHISQKKARQRFEQSHPLR